MRASVGSRLRMVMLSLGLLVAGGSLGGCHRSAADKAAQAAPSPESIKQSFADVKKEFSDTQQNFTNLSKAVEAIPTNMRGYPQLRAHFYAVEEARGVTAAKVTLLSSRVDSALSSKKPEELRQASKDIAGASEDARKISALYIKLLHEVMAFQRVANDRRQALDAAGAGSPTAKATPTQSKQH